jgi:hypothetical protein
MAQFGAGSQLAAQCPAAPVPDGWRNWTDADGPVPDALAQRAAAIAADQTVPLGATESYPLPGVVTLLRAETRVWGHNEQGALVPGCFRVGGIYLPVGAAAGAAVTPPEPDKISKVVGWLTATSLVVGTVATLTTWGK